MLRDGRFRWVAGIVLALLLVSLGAGFVHWRDARSQSQAASVLAREHWTGQEPKNPHSAAHYGVYVFKPQLPLSFVDRGVDPYTGTTVWLEAHRQNDFLFRPAQDATAAQRFGNLTTAAALQLLVPLLIILITFGAFAGEREQGTLRQLLSVGVGRRALGWGKALGVAAALALLLVPAAMLGAAALVLGNAAGPLLASPQSGEALIVAMPLAPTLGRSTLLALTYAGYFAVFVAVSIAVSARAPSSRIALLGLLAFWIVNGLVAPRAAADLAKRVHAAPSAFEFARTVREQLENGLDGEGPAAARAAELERRVLTEYGVDRVEDLPINFSGLSLQASEEHGDEVFDANYGALWETFGRQSRVHEAVGIVAPLLAVRSISMGLAGTDFEQHRHFATAAEQYRRMLVKRMNDDLAYNSRMDGPVYVADETLWRDVPPFEYQAPSAAWVLGRRAGGVGVLLLWVAGALITVVLSTRRVRID